MKTSLWLFHVRRQLLKDRKLISWKKVRFPLSQIKKAPNQWIIHYSGPSVLDFGPSMLYIVPSQIQLRQGLWWWRERNGIDLQVIAGLSEGLGNPAFVVWAERNSREETDLKMGMSFNGIFRKSDNMVSRNIAGETIIVPIRGKLADMQRIFAISEVAEHIWENLDGKKSLDEIRDDIVATFDVEKARADADLEEFIAELLEAGLILEVK